MKTLNENNLKGITKEVINNSPYGDIFIQNNSYSVGFCLSGQGGHKLSTTKGKILVVALHYVNEECPVKDLENLTGLSPYQMLYSVMALQNTIKKSYQYELRIPSFLGEGAYITLQEKTNQK